MQAALEFIMGTEDNNNGKHLSRQQISIVINSIMDDRPIRMLELLGAGIGAEFYCNSVPSIGEMHLVEYSKKKYDNWMKNEYGDFIKRIPKEVLITTWQADVNDIFVDETISPYNVVNLDFCTYFYDNEKSNCPAYIIGNLLRNNKIEDDGLLLLTFQLTGIGANISPQSIKDRDIIIERIAKIAALANWSIDEVVFSYTYKSSKPTRMLNLGLRMKYNGETLDKKE